MPKIGPIARLREAWRVSELDEALAEGADPLASDELTLRALHLSDREHRASLARTLEILVNHVSNGGPSPASLRARRREPIKNNRAELVTLAWRLREGGFHCLRGLALADRTIRFGDSPLYTAETTQKLRRRIENILAALEVNEPTAPASRRQP